jgi:hypothetical protein
MDERLAGDFDQGFRDPFGDRAEPGGEAAGEDGNRNRRRSGHWAMTLVPSKSK